MEIKPGCIVHLGYGKYWRSDHIVGLSPIEQDRGPRRRTEVYVTERAEPLIASRSEHAILQDMVTLPEEIFRAEEARAVLGDLLDDLRELSPIIQRMLRHEANFDVSAWERRLSGLLQREGDAENQEDLFAHPQ
ncbi:MAG: hypothetical protein HY701_06910 [Gemmatimonadetes bacterium]|nr:hypothetical protein [Gemmatimonadota bacterium]